MNWQQGWQQFTPSDGVTVDLFCAKGDRPGKVALISAGVHGDEYEGPAAVQTLVQNLRPSELSGTILAIPVMNPSAFAAGTRTNPEDGLNLARCFPGNVSGKPTEQLAAGLFTKVAAPADYLIDLHSGGVEYLFLPLAGFYGPITEQNASFRAARQFGLPCLWQLPETPGVLSYELHSRGAVVIGNEYLGSGQLANQGVMSYRDGIIRCLRSWGLLPATDETGNPQKIFTGDWQLAAATGLFRTEKQLGEVVRRGEAVASIVDTRGQVIQEFQAEQDGMIVALRSKAYIRTGDWAVLTGAVHHV